MSSVGNRIAQRRKALRLTQEQLAEIAGTTQKQISGYENGHNQPQIDALMKIAMALDTTSDYLLGLTDIPDRPMRGQADLSDDELRLVELYRRTARGRRPEALQMLQILSGNDPVHTKG